MTKKKKVIESPTATTTPVPQLGDKFATLLQAGRSMEDIERISKYANLENEFIIWKQHYETTKQKTDL